MSWHCWYLSSHLSTCCQCQCFCLEPPPLFLLNLDLCHSSVLVYAHPDLSIMSWDSFTVCVSKAPVNLPIHASFCNPQSSMVLLIDLTHSFNNCLSAFLMMLKLLGVLIVFLNFKLTGVISLLHLLRVNLL